MSDIVERRLRNRIDKNSRGLPGVDGDFIDAIAELTRLRAEIESAYFERDRAREICASGNVRIAEDLRTIETLRARVKALEEGLRTTGNWLEAFQQTAMHKTEHDELQKDITRIDSLLAGEPTGAGELRCACGRYISACGQPHCSPSRDQAGKEGR